MDSERKESDLNRTGTPSRDDYERDYGRIVHSAAFRRLQSKTQVFGVGEGDFHRTRLTHSMEVAQIARGISLALNLKDSILNGIHGKIDTSLIEAAALSHDFGHPPFGHQGERALNEKMINFGGFEGNAQTFRILTRLERGNGLNLTRATLMAILKYPILYSQAVNVEVYNQHKYSPPKTSVYDDDKERFEWVTNILEPNEKDYYSELDKMDHKQKHHKTKHKSLECSIIELADDIAYATHDVEDALRLKLIDISELIDILKKYRLENDKALIKAANKLEDLIKGKINHSSQIIKDAIADIISLFISSVKIQEENCYTSPRIRYKAVLPAKLEDLINDLTKIVKEKVIDLQRVQTLEWKGGYVVKKLFEALQSEKKLLRISDQVLINTGMNLERVVCDYIAGMTDSYAIKMYSRLYESKESRLFDI
ncbi:hypothetical protein AR543_01445 [Paenibacillus bovis]|uniref:Deoxyguanosinetriphosphate triphosphohydrolase-like protein n=1 Tax=Paenibacillus bovis TaxID=1616788 RepID=A0A172ZLR7_9BACL|nr:hypothetical protein AR543_01445 [Paenibacillus bovis]